MKHVEHFNIPVLPGSREYCRVNIFDTVEHMREYILLRHPEWTDDQSDTVALATTGVFSRRGQRTNLVAEVFFYEATCAGTISHEFLHVVFGLAARRELRAVGHGRKIISRKEGCVTLPAEERLCQRLAYFVGTFWKRWIAAQQRRK